MGRNDGKLRRDEMDQLRVIRDHELICPSAGSLEKNEPTAQQNMYSLTIIGGADPSWL